MIPRKKKTCKGCGQERYLFGRGLCDSCYRRAQKPLQRRSQLKQGKTPRKERKAVKHAYWGYEKQLEMFHDIWDNMDVPRICPISGKKLDGLWNTDRWHWCFAHILPKGNYPKYKLFADNIMVIHPEAHTLIDQGTEEQRAALDWEWDMFYSRAEELKKSYKKLA